MHTKTFAQQIEKNTNNSKRKLYLCCILSTLLSGYYGYALIQSINDYTKQKNENKNPKISKILLPLTISILSIFLTSESFKYTFKLSLNKKRKKSVSKEILNQLFYINKPQNNKCTLYDPLTPSDIKELVKTIDFSQLESETQKNILQNIITVAHSSPFVAKIIKSKLRASSIQIDKNLNCGGIACFSNEIETEAKIKIKDDKNILAIIHEIFHLKQAKDGSYCSKELYHYLHLMNEAQAKGLNFITDYAVQEECVQLGLMKKNFISWKNKLYFSQLKKISHENKHLTPREQKGKAEERTIGILMKCLLESSPKKRVQFFESNCGTFSSKSDQKDFQEYCDSWRNTYINDAILERENVFNKKLTHTANILQYEISKIPEFDSYFTHETGIQQNIKNIKITSDNNALFSFSINKKEHQKQ